jgi:hypothetical protein
VIEAKEFSMENQKVGQRDPPLSKKKNLLVEKLRLTKNHSKKMTDPQVLVLSIRKEETTEVRPKTNPVSEKVIEI